jgi:hypothetical protein
MKWLTLPAIILGLGFGVTVGAAGRQDNREVHIGTALRLTLLSVPGARNKAVTQATIHSTVCVSGYSASVRPPSFWTSAYKKHLLPNRGGTLAEYQLDHAISLELGGAGWSTANLWLEAQPQASLTDHYENELHAKLCSGQMTLKQAQAAELSWKRTNG